MAWIRRQGRPLILQDMTIYLRHCVQAENHQHQQRCDNWYLIHYFRCYNWDIVVLFTKWYLRKQVCEVGNIHVSRPTATSIDSFITWLLSAHIHNGQHLNSPYCVVCCLKYTGLVYAWLIMFFFTMVITLKKTILHQKTQKFCSCIISLLFFNLTLSII